MRKKNRTWADAVERYRAERADRAGPTIKREEALLAWLAPRLRRKRLDQITLSVFAELRAAARDEKWGPRSRNYALGVARTVLNAAVQWEWLALAPKVKKEKLPGAHVQWLTQPRAQALVSLLPMHLADAAAFTLQTGLRKGTLTRLEWSMVDWENRVVSVPCSIVKNRADLLVPLSDSALEILRRRALMGGRWVFTYRGKRLQEPGGAVWRAALRELGIQNFRWHDLRHTWASWHVQAGTPLAVLKELGGWKSVQMVMVYAHLNTTQLHQAAGNMPVLKLAA